MFRKSLVLPCALLLTVASLSAFQAKPVDLTGTWTGTLTRDGREPGTAHIILTQKGTNLTGSVGPNAQSRQDITKGTVAVVKTVTSATFESAMTNGQLWKFDLKLTEGRLKGPVTVTAPDGQTLTGTIDVGREKAK